MDRIDDAVTRIIGVKLAMGLVKDVNDEPVTIPNKKLEIDEMRPAHEAARDTAEQSFVLLKNEKLTIPIDQENTKYIVLTGERTIDESVKGQSVTTVYQDFNNIGAQNGGWSVAWQGYEGNFFWNGDLKTQSHASSILDALYELEYKPTLLFPQYADPTNANAVNQARSDFIQKLNSLTDMTSENTIVINILAESPYAEFMGDINNPFCYGTTDFIEGCLYNAHAN
jgi:beta-glucosidase